MTRDAKYKIAIQYGGTPPPLPPDLTALRIYDGNNYCSHINIQPGLYWSEEDGRS
jgi:hypothetical protein